jgi:hypothetical protein
MRSVRPSHNIEDLWAFIGVTMKILEVPKSPWKGFDPMAPIKPPTLYINQKPYFSEEPPIAANLPPP